MSNEEIFENLEIIREVLDFYSRKNWANKGTDILLGLDAVEKLIALFDGEPSNN
jgi:hypothetical protein